MMQFSVEAGALRTAVERMKPAQSPRRDWVARFSTNSIDGLVTLETIGFTVSASASALATVDIDGVVVLPLTKLAVWLTTVEGRVDVELEDDRAVFTTSEAELPAPVYVSEVGVLPDEPGDDMGLSTEVWEAVKRVAFASLRLTGDATPSLKHMLHVQGERVWATDGYTYAEVAVPGNTTSVSFYPETAGVLRSLDSFTASVDTDKRIHLVDGTGTYVLSTFAGEVPTTMPDATRRLIGYEPAGEVTFDRKALLDALGALGKVKAADSDRVVVRIDGLLCELEVDTGDGTSTREITVTCDAATTFGVDLRFLTEAAVALHGDDFGLTFGDGLKPMWTIEDDLLVVLMPIRLEGQSRPTKRGRAKKAA